MRKRILFIVVAILMVGCVFALSACDIFNDILKEGKWSYSETGEAEIKLNNSEWTKDWDGLDLNELTQEEIENTSVSSTTKWRAFATTAGETEEVEFTTYHQAKVVDGVLSRKFKFSITLDEVVYHLLVIDGTTYRINETEKTVAVETTQTDVEAWTKIGSIYTFWGTCGIVRIENWTFESKDENATITNYDNEDEEVVSYFYNSKDEEGANHRTEARFDFRKVITPVMSRISYKVYVGEELENDITLYKVYSVSATADDFEVPQDYTNLDEE